MLVDNKTIQNSDTVYLLGITLDSNLNLLPHVTNMCKSVNQRTNALNRIRGNISQEKATRLANSFILSIFNYCPLIWMFCNKTANTLINTSHKRALRVILGDSEISFEEALAVTGSKSLHYRNLELLMVEVYKSINSLNPAFMFDIFSKKITSYSFRAGNILKPPKIDGNMRFISLNSLALRSTLAWNMLPKLLKECENILKFKSDVKSIKIYCQCKICCYF